MRRFSAVVFLVTVSAAAGCTTVSAPPAPARAPGPSAPRLANPDGGVLVPPPDHEVLETARPDPAGAPSPTRVKAARKHAADADEAAPHRERVREPVHRPRREHRHNPAPAATWPVASLPGRAGVCALGEAYGGWAADSDAARICRQSYGR